MPKTTIFYSVQNGGDGSAYPRFMESKDLAEWDQEQMEEGWGESCTGSISFESDSPIRCLDKVETKETYLIDKYCDQYNDEKRSKRTKFIAKFFPKGLPKFSVETEPVKGETKYLYNNIFVDGVKVGQSFRTKGASGKVFEKFLNSL